MVLMKFAPLSLGLLFSLSWSVGVAGEHTAPSKETPPAALYHNYCSVCHGDRGDGQSRAKGSLNPSPRDFTTSQSRTELSRARMILGVKEGRPGTAMVAWKSQLNDRQIEALVDYIRGAFMHVDGGVAIPDVSSHGTPAPIAKPPSTNPAVADLKLPMPNGLSGDAARGKAFYLHNCATCHGANGDGNGPRAYFINPKPRNFLSAESRGLLNRPAIYTFVSAGKVGTEMPSWDKVLTSQQIADVSEFVFQSFIRNSARKDRLSQNTR